MNLTKKTSGAIHIADGAKQSLHTPSSIRFTLAGDIFLVLLRGKRIYAQSVSGVVINSMPLTKTNFETLIDTLG
jgi:hypothetical protein